MDDDMPDMPLENFGPTTEVAAPPAAEEVPTSEQTTQPTETTGSDTGQPSQTEQKADNPIVEEPKGGRPEKQERLQNRFGELTGKIKERDSQIEELQAQIARQQALAGVQPITPDEEGNYSLEAIQQNQQQVAQATATAEVSLLRQQLERDAIANRFESEGNQLETKYKDEFEKNPVLLENIQATIEEQVQLNIYNPQALKQISPLKIAERYMKTVEAVRRDASTVTAQNLQTIKAENAEAPQNVPSAIDDNSVEAIEARLADVKF